jgi:hypothetical protein
MRRFAALAVLAVLLAPACAFGTLWDYTSSYLVEPTQDYYSQAAWAPWSAGYVSSGTFSPYDSFHWDPANPDGGYHDAWYMTPDGDYGPAQQGAACKNLSGVVNQINLGGGFYVYEELGQTVQLAGTSATAAVQWTAPTAGWYQADAVYTGQETYVQLATRTNVSISSGGTALSTGIVDGFIGTAANGYEDGFDGTVGTRSVTCTGTKYLDAGQTFLFTVQNITGAMSWVGTVLTVQTTTAPEPSSMVLLAAGLIGLLAYAWRKRK